jgi:hypothetical protein
VLEPPVSVYLVVLVQFEIFATRMLDRLLIVPPDVVARYMLHEPGLNPAGAIHEIVTASFELEIVVATSLLAAECGFPLPADSVCTL